jgi:hypothetical protein
MLTSKRKAHLIIITTFILGAVVGASGQFLLSNQLTAQRAPSVEEVANELTRVVKLDQSQRVQAEQILNDCRQQYQELRKQTKPQYLAIRDNTRKRIQALLSTEQQSLYDRWLNELDAKRNKKSSENARHAEK